VAEAHEAVIQRTVPRFDSLVVGGDDLLHTAMLSDERLCL
jgi:hypothetical protein